MKLKGLETMIESVVGDAPHEIATVSYGAGFTLLGDFTADVLPLCDLRRTGNVSGWHRNKRTYKRKRNGERCAVSSRTAEYYQKRGESHVTGRPATELGRGRQPAKTVGKREEGSE